METIEIFRKQRKGIRKSIADALAMMPGAGMVFSGTIFMALQSRPSATWLVISMILTITGFGWVGYIAGQLKGGE